MQSRLWWVAVLLLACCSLAVGQIKGMVSLSPKLAAGGGAPSASSQAANCNRAVVDSLVFDRKSLGVENVVVFVANVRPDSLPATRLLLDIQACRYQPHVFAVFNGDSLIIRNRDNGVRHARGRLRSFRPGWNTSVTKDILVNVSKTVFNIAMPGAETSGEAVLEEAGLIEIVSEGGVKDMRGYLWVLPHRFFAVSNPKGEFQISGLPPSDYDVILWHETLGIQRQLVKVGASGETRMDFVWGGDAITESDSTATIPESQDQEQSAAKQGESR